MSSTPPIKLSTDPELDPMIDMIVVALRRLFGPRVAVVRPSDDADTTLRKLKALSEPDLH